LGFLRRRGRRPTLRLPTRDAETHPHKKRWVATTPISAEKARKRKIPITTVIILILTAVAGIGYYLGTPTLKPSVTPTLGSCPTAAHVVVDNSAASKTSTKNYQPPGLSVVIGVNNTVTWTDEDPGFERHVISVAVPPGGPEWDLNMTDTPGANTQCVSLTAPGTYTYEMFVPYIVAGTIVVKGSASSTAG